MQKISWLEGEIEALQDYLREAESYPLQDSLWGRLRRSLRLFFLRREVTRQVEQLRMQRNAALNCYHQIERDRARKMDGVH